MFPTRAYRGTFTDLYGYDAMRRQRDMDAATYRSVEAARAVNHEYDRMCRNVGNRSTGDGNKHGNKHNMI